jgi:hypothetical protein
MKALAQPAYWWLGLRVFGTEVMSWRYLFSFQDHPKVSPVHQRLKTYHQVMLSSTMLIWLHDLTSTSLVLLRFLRASHASWTSTRPLQVVLPLPKRTWTEFGSCVSWAMVHYFGPEMATSVVRAFDFAHILVCYWSVVVKLWFEIIWNLERQKL